MTDDLAVEVHRLPSLVATHAHLAYLADQITRQEWIHLCRLHTTWLTAATALEGASSSSEGRARGAPPA